MSGCSYASALNLRPPIQPAFTLSFFFPAAKQMSRGKCLDVFEPVTQVPSELQTKPRRSNPRRTH